MAYCELPLHTPSIGCTLYAQANNIVTNCMYQQCLKKVLIELRDELPSLPVSPDMHGSSKVCS